MRATREDTTADAHAADLPIAQAAVTVAGQCRERSPVDVAVFGEEADRFVERFAERPAGEALLARAIAEGAADATCLLRASSGFRDFRVSLWRQRGGDRIRLLAAFAATGPAAPFAPQGGQVLAQVARIGHEIKAPLRSVIGQADAIRADPAALGPSELSGRAADIVSASWRMLSLAEDLSILAATGESAGVDPVREIDLARLVSRALREAAPLAASAGVRLQPPALPDGGLLPAVLAGELGLWGVIDDLLRGAICQAMPGGTVAVRFERASEGGLAVEITGQRDASSAQEMAPRRGRNGLDGLPVRGPDQLGRLLAEDGATLEVLPKASGGSVERISFPASRCLPVLP